MISQFFFLELEDTVLSEEDSVKQLNGEVDQQGRSSLADMLLDDFSELPKKGKADLDEYAVINVGPSVVPNPYVPTFRIYAYNATGESDDQPSSGLGEETQMKKKKKNKKGKKKGRDHRHKHPGKESDVDCKKKQNRGTWACRPRKPHYASKESPSRRNAKWTPLGYAQVGAGHVFSLLCNELT